MINDKNNISFINNNLLLRCFTILTFIIFIIFLFITLYYKFNYNGINANYNENIIKLQNHKINSLLNGSGINNIPNLIINTPNNELQEANNCTTKPKHIDDSLNNTIDCKKICLNSHAELWDVNENDDIIFDNEKLLPGKYCSISQRPQCNSRTSIAIMTINSVNCHTKYPEVFGGDLGNTIIACNNAEIYHPNNILWDYKNNEPVSSFSLTLNYNFNEIMENGKFRYRCKFGTDDKDNTYLEHPFHRFHPIVNKCAQYIYKAHPDVKTTFINNNTDYICDCGNEQETRVKNLIIDDKRSSCSNIQSITLDISKRPTKKKYETTLVYECFNLYSPITDVGTKRPCPTDLFTKHGSTLASVKFNFTTNRRALIEHPYYDDFADDDESGIVIYANGSTKNLDQTDWTRPMVKINKVIN